MIGTSVGPYHVLSKLGQGGMGDVWKAHDSKLQRPVAIKILKHQTPDAAAGGMPADDVIRYFFWAERAGDIWIMDVIR